NPIPAFFCCLTAARFQTLAAMTTRRIKRISPLQAGKMCCALYGCLGLIALPFLLLAGALGAFAQQAHGSQGAPAAIIGGMFCAMAILVPIFYAIMGFLIGVIGAAIYNLLAAWIGGIEVGVE